MSTRCTLTVRDVKGAAESYSLYRHYDGYPDTVIPDLVEALSYAWPLPRFEADDFAAAIVAAFKKPARYAYPGAKDIAQGGNIRLTAGRDAHCDTEYHYEIYAEPAKRPIDRDRLCIERLCIEVYGRTYGGTKEWKRVGRRSYLTKAMQPAVPEMPTSVTVDVQAANCGSIVGFTPMSEAGETWLAQNLPEAQCLDSYGVMTRFCEPRYADDILAGMEDAGLVLDSSL